MAIKVKDIAQILGISPSTVSMVLNNKQGISEETRQKVFKVITELGYDTNILSKPALKNNKSIRFIVYKKHGKVVSDTPFFSELMEGIDSEARKNGYNLVISYLSETDNKMDVLRIVEENPLDGIILLATEMEPEDVQLFMNIKLPMVVLDSYFQSKKVDTVVINNVQGSYEATSYLTKMGHTSIGYLHSSIHINNFDERSDGHFKALKDAGIKSDKKNVFELESTLEGSYRDMREILLYVNKLPTAFFADNDIIAFGAIKALKGAGYQIPKDISIISFDDMPFCEMIDPPLTTIRVYKQRMGMFAVRRLIEKIEDKSEEFVKIEIGTEICIRKSVSNLDTSISD